MPEVAIAAARSSLFSLGGFVPPAAAAIGSGGRGDATRASLLLAPLPTSGRSDGAGLL